MLTLYYKDNILQNTAHGLAMVAYILFVVGVVACVVHLVVVAS